MNNIGVLLKDNGCTDNVAVSKIIHIFIINANVHEVSIITFKINFFERSIFVGTENYIKHFLKRKYNVFVINNILTL